VNSVISFFVIIDTVYNSLKLMYHDCAIRCDLTKYYEVVSVT